MKLHVVESRREGFQTPSGHSDVRVGLLVSSVSCSEQQQKSGRRFFGKHMASGGATRIDSNSIKFGGLGDALGRDERHRRFHCRKLISRLEIENFSDLAMARAS